MESKGALRWRRLADPTFLIRDSNRLHAAFSRGGRPTLRCTSRFRSDSLIDRSRPNFSAGSWSRMTSWRMRAGVTPKRLAASLVVNLLSMTVFIAGNVIVTQGKLIWTGGLQPGKGDMHWPIDVELIRPLIPQELKIDTFNGTAWMSAQLPSSP
jgi:hypothetical protein